MKRKLLFGVDPELLRDSLLCQLPTEYLAWLLRHYGLRRRRPHMSLCVTTACNRRCKECIQRNILGDSRAPHMPLDELEQLIDVSAKSHYEFDFIISGGEPLLWPHLAEGVRMLRASGVSGSIRLFTNALDLRSFQDETAARLDQIRISKYPENHRNIEELVRKYASKVVVVDRERFWPNPATPIPGALPPRCCTPHPWLWGRRVYFCAHCASIARGHGHDGVLSIPLAVGFLKPLCRLKREQQRSVCVYCFHNAKVRAQLVPTGNLPGAITP